MVDTPTRLIALQQICVQFHVAALYAFGSQAEQVSHWLRGELPHLESGPSDVDIGVKAVRGIT